MNASNIEVIEFCLPRSGYHWQVKTGELTRRWMLQKQSDDIL